jgi:hypothetical protein
MYNTFGTDTYVPSTYASERGRNQRKKKKKTRKKQPLKQQDLVLLYAEEEEGFRTSY